MALAFGLLNTSMVSLCGGPTRWDGGLASIEAIAAHFDVEVPRTV